MKKIKAQLPGTVFLGLLITGSLFQSSGALAQQIAKKMGGNSHSISKAIALLNYLHKFSIIYMHRKIAKFSRYFLTGLIFSIKLFSI